MNAIKIHMPTSLIFNVGSHLYMTIWIIFTSSDTLFYVILGCMSHSTLWVEFLLSFQVPSIGNMRRNTCSLWLEWDVQVGLQVYYPIMIAVQFFQLQSTERKTARHFICIEKQRRRVFFFSYSPQQQVHFFITPGPAYSYEMNHCQTMIQSICSWLKAILRFI